jgi:branched-chain amino acid transport system substrate-binding protein
MTPLALAALAGMLGACSNGGGSSSSNAAGTTVKIGIDLPTSGGDASVGLSTQQGALLAIEQAQKKGLPGGLGLAAYPLDDAVQGVHSPQQGVANVRTFASDDAVLAMIGPYNSNVAAAEIPVTNAAGLAQIGPSVVSDGLTMGDAAKMLRRANPTVNAFFRVCSTDSRQGSALAQFARKLNYKSVYIIDDNETYGLDLANRFEQDFKALGGSVLGHDHLAKNTQDFKALLIKVAGVKPDLVFYGGVTSTGGGLIRKQMFGTGLGKVPFMGGDGIADLATVAGKLSDGTYYTLAAPNAEKLPAAQTFVKDYVARYHTPIGPYSANAYAAAEVAINAVVLAAKADGNKLPTRAQVLAQVAKTDALATPIGPIGFDANGDVKNPVISLYGFKNGVPYFINQINLKT